jgi:hypothetical protein
MSTKFLLPLVAAFVLQASAAWAQFGMGKPKDIAAVKSQPLIIVLKDEDPKELKKLAKKEEEMATYQTYIANYNAQMQELAPKLWSFSPAVEFRHESELPALRKAKGPQRAVFQHLNFRATHRHGAGGLAAPGMPSNYYYTSEQVSAMVLQLLGNGDESQVWRLQIAPGAVYNSDLIFGLRSCQSYFKGRADGRSRADVKEEIARNGKRLRTKTLLIDEADVKSSLTAADIKQAYPFPYQIVPRLTIETAAATSDPRYAYIRLLPATESIMVQVAVDAADSELLGYSLPGRVQLMGIGGTGAAIGKGNLKDFAQGAGGK